MIHKLYYESLAGLMTNNKRTYFFCGIGGSGMNSIAQVLNHNGHVILGSDRNFDQDKGLSIRNLLVSQGIKIFPQDGSGISCDVDEVVVSTAIEHTIPDVQEAVRQNISVIKRAQILAKIFNAGKRGIAVGGTSGKSTVTGMIGHILMQSGKYPTVINGAEMINAKSSTYSGSLYCNDNNLIVIEADESDGTIDYYQPDIAVITKISLDHKPLDELRRIFYNFSRKSTMTTVLNLDCGESQKLLNSNHDFTTFSLKNNNADIVAESMKLNSDKIGFEVNNQNFSLNVMGDFNLANALAAIAACRACGISMSDCANALTTFKGIKRRLQLVGCINGISVIDDFAHNPGKIMASLNTLKRSKNRLLVMFQPHGHAPTHLARNGLIKAFSDILDENDLFIMPDIYYAGGTVDKKISSSEIVEAIKLNGINAEYISNRARIADRFLEIAHSGDSIVIMGARDDTLTEFATRIVQGLQYR